MRDRFKLIVLNYSGGVFIANWLVLLISWTLRKTRNTSERGDTCVKQHRRQKTDTKLFYSWIKQKQQRQRLVSAQQIFLSEYLFLFLNVWLFFILLKLKILSKKMSTYIETDINYYYFLIWIWIIQIKKTIVNYEGCRFEEFFIASYVSRIIIKCGNLKKCLKYFIYRFDQ